MSAQPQVDFLDASRNDYRKAIAEHGINEEQARAISENESDQLPFPKNIHERVIVAKSDIEGQGLFVIAPIVSGEVIAPARIGGKRTPAGRYTNHSIEPNAEMVALLNGGINLVAIRPIQQYEEVTVDYRQARQTAILADKNLSRGQSLTIEVKRAVRIEITRNFQEKERRRHELEARERIAKLQAALEGKGATAEHAECPLEHTFTPGLYVRKITVPKRATVVTKIHKHEHVVFVLKGDCLVYSNDGTLKRVTAPCMMITPAGTKRAVYVNDETVWATVHPNPDNETDLEKLESILIAKNYEDIPLLTEASKKIEGGTP